MPFYLQLFSLHFSLLIHLGRSLLFQNKSCRGDEIMINAQHNCLICFRMQQKILSYLKI